MAFAIGTPLLDACVLAVLDRGDTYGYVLTQQVKEVLDISESTLYPVLRRLQQEGALGVYDQPYQGRNRRYYTISALGRRRLEESRRDWQTFRDGVDRLIMTAEADLDDKEV